MRFMTLVKSAESSGPPPSELLGAIAKLGAEAAQARVLVERCVERRPDEIASGRRLGS
jgi:hypothetical protein